MKMLLWFVAYGWMIVAGAMHYIVDVVSQYIRGVRAPSDETTYYYGMNTAYSLGQVVFGLLGLILALKAPQLLGQWPAVVLTIAGAVGWLVISFMFLPYKEPRFVSAISTLLIIAAAVRSYLNV